MGNRLFCNNPAFPDAPHCGAISSLADISIKQCVTDCPNKVFRIFLEQVCSSLIYMSDFLVKIDCNDRGSNAIEYSLDLLSGAHQICFFFL